MRTEDLDEKNKYATAERIGTKPFRTLTRAFCYLCRRTVRLVEFERAAGYLETTFAELLPLADRNELHRLHNADAVMMICSDSLERYFENRTTRSLRLEQISADLHLTK
jgi:hypothetical protein